MINGVIPAIITGLDSNITFAAQLPCTLFILRLDFRVVTSSIPLHDLGKLADVKGVVQTAEVKMVLMQKVTRKKQAKQ